MTSAFPTATRYAPRGMVCTVDHLATAAGVDVLAGGGNAVDAAIAAHAVLAVTAPHLCGLGGDLFALVHGAGGAPAALDASGRAGSGADPERLRAEGRTSMPFHGDIRSVPVPGCVDGVLALHARYATRDLAALVAPAVRLAEEGFPASPILVRPASRLEDVEGAGDLSAATRPGAVVRRPGVARTLRGIAAHGRDAFYGGEFGAGLLALGAVDARGGVRPEYDASDLARNLADWVAPISTRAWGHTLWSTPPASQGYLLLLAAEIADGLDLPDDADDPLWAHLLVEASRAAGHDRLDVLHEGATAPLGEADALRAEIDPARRTPRFDPPQRDGDTTYLCVVDGDGLAVSLIQSNAAGFGSGLFEPSTGINLQNRGVGFTLRPGHPAEYGPGRRPPHTLTPALVTRPDGSLRAVVGTMGGDSQPQLLLQVLARLLAGGATAGEAIGASRWRLDSGATGFDTWEDAVRVEVEHGSPWADGLRERGHEVVEAAAGVGFGHAHLIDVTDEGVRAGAADPRAVIGAASGV
ncbi:gamma-glutamyltransferase family protein [Luteimicrobium sp. DT211]|uniref:gamma-glutamyltransferase family protein n=1 Tax=Luteimicrobium sp. DT211 TaxID=3393412 RepID=UPI003CEBB5DC